MACFVPRWIREACLEDPWSAVGTDIGVAESYSVPDHLRFGLVVGVSLTPKCFQTATREVALTLQVLA